MDSIIQMIPRDQLIYAVIGVMLPTITGFLFYLKTQKDEVLETIFSEVDDIFADLNQAKQHFVDALDFVEDGIEGIIEGLAPESPGGRTLTESEKAEALDMADRALSSLKLVKEKMLESVKIGD